MKYALPIILIVVFLLRLTSFFEPYWYGDEGISLTLGQAWRHGLILYQDITDNKPPLLYIVSGFAYTLPWLKIITTLWTLTTIALFWQLSSLILKRQSQVIFATSIFALMTTLPRWEGNSANGEIFFLLPVLAGVIVVLRITHLTEGKLTLPFLSKSEGPHPPPAGGPLLQGERVPPLQMKRGQGEFDGSRWPFLMLIRLFIAGSFFGIGFLFKNPAAFDLLAFLLLPLFLIKLNNLQHWRTTFIYGITLMAGFLFPTLLTALWFAYQHSFWPFYNAVFGSNFTYIGIWEPLARWGRTGDFGGTVIQRLSLAIILTTGLWLVRRQLPTLITIICLWFIWNLFGTTLSGRPYPHYLLQATPLLAIFLTLGLTANHARTQIVSISALAIFWLAWGRMGYWSYPVSSYYQNFWQYATGQQSYLTYRNNFDPHVSEIYSISQWLKTSTTPQDRVFLWGDDAQIFALAGRLPATKYVAAYHVEQANAYQEVIEFLRQHPPTIIIISADKARPYPQLDDFLGKKYLEVHLENIRGRVYRYIGDLMAE